MVLGVVVGVVSVVDFAPQQKLVHVAAEEERELDAVQQAEAVVEYSQQVVQRVSSEAGEQLRWAQLVHSEEQSELAALKQQLASRAAHEVELRQALQDADVVLREQVAKAYQDGHEKTVSMA